MSIWADDLRFANQVGKAVQVTLYDGRDFKLVGVHEVNEDEGWVTLHTPQTMDDQTTRTRVRLEDINSLTVTDVAW